MSKVESHKSSIGDLDANVLTLVVYIVAAVLSWIPVVKFFAWVLPLVIYLLEKKSSFVKAHSLQALILFLVSFVFSLFIWLICPKSLVSVLKHATWVGFLGIVSVLFGIAVTVITILATIKAYNYEDYEIPFVGKYASKIEAILNNIVNSGAVKTTAEPVKETAAEPVKEVTPEIAEKSSDTENQ